MLYGRYNLLLYLLIQASCYYRITECFTNIPNRQKNINLQLRKTIFIQQPQQQEQQDEETKQYLFPVPPLRISSSLSKLYQTTSSENNPDSDINELFNCKKFNLTTSLFCAGLAFDAYASPPASRWEKNPQGLNVAFVSPAYTRTLYSGLLEVTPMECSDMPNEDNTAESVVSGGSIDAYLLVAIAEGRIKEDMKMLKEPYHNGVLDLQGSAHVGQSSTAWGNVNEKKAAVNKKQGKSAAYSIPSTWTSGAKAVWKDDPPFFLYIQDPQKAHVVLSVVDENVMGEDIVIGSSYKLLKDLIKNMNEKDIFGKAKEKVIEKVKKEKGKISEEDIAKMTSKEEILKLVIQEWEGEIKLQTKPKTKDKGGQVRMGVVAGALVAGPAGAAVGGFLGNLYEGNVRGSTRVKLRYLPIPKENMKRTQYIVKGGLPGVAWGELYQQHVTSSSSNSEAATKSEKQSLLSDFELCAFVTHDKTGCSCAVYRSLEKRLIAVSFRGTCEPMDLLTDANIIQTPWVEGVDLEKEKDGVPMVHVGFRNSLNSISRRLKELIIAAVAPTESLTDYDLLITGHSLGGSLATLFTADIAEFGMDAGRALPQLEPSEPWWSSLSNNFFSKGKSTPTTNIEGPPRPKSLRVYSFGSPRVGNKEFVAKFDSLLKNGNIQEAYRVVNNADIVARLPRSMNALMFGAVGYDHCGPTALVSLPKASKVNKDKKDGEPKLNYEDIVDDVNTPLLWIEGESDDNDCPVRDGKKLTSDPLASGALLGDLFDAVKNVTASSSSSKTDNQALNAKNSSSFSLSGASNYVNQLSSMASDITSSVSNRLQTFSVSDVTSIVGLNKNYTDREMKIVQSVFTGEALAHHMEDEYYQAVGRACGFMALVGKEIQSLDEIKSKLEEMDEKDISDLCFLKDMEDEEECTTDLQGSDNAASLFL